LETVGDAHVENSVKKYGTGSMEFGGNGDYLDIPTNHLVDDFGAGDFTIEGWAYLKSDPASSYHSLFHTGFSLQIYINDSTVKMWASNDGSSYNIVSGLTGPTSAVSQNTWFHWAVVRNGSSFKVYVNGVVGNSGTSSDSIYYDGTPRIADYAPNTGTYPFDGYMDDFRITKGVARYTANFTPPEAKLPNL